MSENVDFTPWPEEIRDSYIRRGYWLGKPLTDILERQCALRPERVAVIAGERQLTYAQLNAAANHLAFHLRGRGLCAGDHAVVQLPNDLEFYVTYWALLKMGVRAVFALFSHNAYELEAFHKQLQPKMMILSRRHKLFKQGEERFRNAFFIEDEALLYSDLAPPPFKPDIEIGASQVAFFQLSGGSTGTPKLIPRTHDDYYYSVRRSAEICELDEKSVYLCALPAPHNFPMSSPGALGIWYGGGCVVLVEDPTPSVCFPLIAEHGVTITSLVPSLVPLWLKAAVTHKEMVKSLQLLQVGGSKLSVTLAERIEPDMGCMLQQVFGMAEGLVCYTRLNDDNWHRYNTQGQPMSAADEIKIVDEEGHPVADHTPGRLMTRGPYTVRGYYRAAEHNARVFDHEGFYTTGDIVQRTPSGHLIVVGREKDQINRGGEKIAAEEVENLLLGFPDVLHAAIVAMPDEALGERSCAFLVCRGELPKPHLIRKYLRTCGIADYKLPDDFRALDTLPLTPVGKPDKARLRQILIMKEANRDHP